MATVTARAAGWAALGYAVAEAGGLAVVGALVAAGPAGGGPPPAAADLSLQALKLVRAGALVAVATWLGAGRSTPSDRLALVAAWLAAGALALSALAGSVPAAGGQAAAGVASGVVARATLLRFAATGAWLLGLGVGHAQARLTADQESAADLLGAVLVVGAVVAPLRLAGVAGAAAWFAWVGVATLRAE